MAHDCKQRFRSLDIATLLNRTRWTPWVMLLSFRAMANVWRCEYYSAAVFRQWRQSNQFTILSHFLYSAEFVSFVSFCFATSPPELVFGFLTWDPTLGVTLCFRCRKGACSVAIAISSTLKSPCSFCTMCASISVLCKSGMLRVSVCMVRQSKRPSKSDKRECEFIFKIHYSHSPFSLYLDGQDAHKSRNGLWTDHPHRERARNQIEGRNELGILCVRNGDAKYRFALHVTWTITWEIPWCNNSLLAVWFVATRPVAMLQQLS